MPRGRLPTVEQLKAIETIMKQEIQTLPRTLAKKLIKNGYVETRGKVVATEKGELIYREAGKSLALLLDYDNLSYQAQEEGYRLLPDIADDFFDQESKKRGLAWESAHKWCFFTTRTENAYFSALSLVEGFDSLGYHVVVTQPAKNRADERMIEVASLLLDHPKIKTIFFASHDNGFNPIIELLEKKKKKVVRISVDNLTTSGVKASSEMALFRPRKEEEKFAEEVGIIIESMVHEKISAMNARFELVRDTICTIAKALSILATPERTMGHRGILRYLVERIFPPKHELGKWHHRVILEILAKQGVISRHPSDKEVRRLKEKEVRRFWVFNPKHSTSVKLLAEFEKRNQQLDDKEKEA